MEPAELSTMLKPFCAEARKFSGRKTIQSQHCESQFVPGWTDFFSGSLQRKPFAIIWDKYSSRQTNPSLKDLARQGLISFTKHQRPISGEDLEVLYAANQLGLNAPESFANSFSTLAEVLHLKRESDEKSVHLQVLQILSILCFTDVNSETEIYFFLVKFMNSSSENMNQKRQVFEFLIRGALRRINFT